MITSILIDDETNALEALEWKLKKYCPKVQILDMVNDPQCAMQSILANKPDCIFLDIQMSKMSGFDLLENLGAIESKIVFVTAYDEYALQAIKVPAFDYLLKPVDKDDLIKVVDRLEKQLQQKKNQLPAFPGAVKNRVGLCINGAISFFDYDEVIFLKAEGNYTNVYLTKNRKEMLSKTLKEVESLFCNIPCFFRVHNSYFINLNHVLAYRKCEGGTLIMSNHKHVSISRSKKEEFLVRML